MLRGSESSSDTDSGSSPQYQMYSRSLQNSAPSTSQKSRCKIVNPTTRRLHQNKLEQQRRNTEHESFAKLNNALPAPQRSRAKILQKAAEYIKHTAHLLPSCVADIRKYTKENRLLEKEIKILEEAKARGDMNSGQNILKDVKQLDKAAYDTDSDCEDAEELESTHSDCEDADETVLMKKRPASSYPSRDEHSSKRFKRSTSGESEDADGESGSSLWNENLVFDNKMPGESDDETTVVNNNIITFDRDDGRMQLNNCLFGEFERLKV